MKEIWKDIEGYEGLYQVSNLGRVKSLNYKRTGKEKILIYRKHKNGYIYIGLCKDGIVKSFRAHRLVAKTFIPNPNNYSQVNHIDENPSNNEVNNLEWCNPKQNANYGTRNEKLSRALKKYIHTKEHRANISEARKKKVICITTGEIFDSIKEASLKMKVNSSKISECCRNKRKSSGKHPITKEKLIWGYFDK